MEIHPADGLKQYLSLTDKTWVVCTLAKITWLLSGSECVKHLIMLLYLSTRYLTWMWGENLEGK